MTKKPKDTFGPIELGGIKKTWGIRDGEAFLDSYLEQEEDPTSSDYDCDSDFQEEEAQAFLDSYVEQEKALLDEIEAYKKYKQEGSLLSVEEQDQGFLDFCLGREKALLDLIEAFQQESLLDKIEALQEKQRVDLEKALSVLKEKCRKQCLEDFEREYNEAEERVRSKHALVGEQIHAGMAERNQDLKNRFQRFKRAFLPKQADTPFSHSDKD